MRTNFLGLRSQTNHTNICFESQEISQPKQKKESGFEWFFQLYFYSSRIFLSFTQGKIYCQSVFRISDCYLQICIQSRKKPLFRAIHYVSLLFFEFRKLVNIVIYLLMYRDFTFCLDNKG